MFRKALGLAAALGAMIAPAVAWADDLPTPLTRAAVLARATANHPSVLAARARAEATDLDARGEGKLPSPELGVDVWQVPLAKPYAIDQAGMFMVGLRQRFPALGSLGPRADAGHAEARAEALEADDRAREVRRMTAHAYVDYEQAAARARTHMDHVALAKRIVDVARARTAGGAPAFEAAQAEVELAQMEADRASDVVLTERTRARLNALLQRPIDAPLADPLREDATVPGLELAELERRAAAARPDVKASRALEEAAEARRVAAKRDWLIPSFSVGVLYFPPTGAATEHAYGASLMVELPWLWGAGKNRADSAARAKDAAAYETRGKSVGVETEVAESDAEARTQALRLRVLEDQVLPATKRALELAQAGYEASRGDLVSLLVAKRAVVDTELQITMTRAALDHALVDLEAAVGGEVPRVPLRSARLP